MKDVKNVEVVENVEEVIKEDTEKKGFGSKLMNNIKTHGKAIVVTIVTATVAVIGAAILYKNRGETEFEVYDFVADRSESDTQDTDNQTEDETVE